jgi:predicted esterase
VGEALDENSPGLPGARIAVPVYNDRGIVDEIVPTSVEDATYHDLCTTGTAVQAAVYPGEHLLTDDEAQHNVLQFIAQRLAGAPPVDSCLTNPNTL